MALFFRTRSFTSCRKKNRSLVLIYLLEATGQEVVQLTEAGAGSLFHLSIHVDRYKLDGNKLVACTENCTLGSLQL